MRSFTRLVTTAMMAWGFGLGHAGCYTSGIPGGSGAGGATLGVGGAGTSAGAESDASDQGGAGDAATAICIDNADCDARTDKKYVCLQSSGSCVECTEDGDCTEPTDSGTPASQAQRYCLHNSCKAFTSCDYPGKCAAGDAGLCNQTLQRCVECLSNLDCTSGTTCSGTICRLACASANTCPNTSPVCLTLATGGGICTERCGVASDCLPGYACVSQACTPSS